MKIGILTDSTCDLPEDLLDKYQIEVIPLTVRIGDQQYKDKVDISSTQFFNIIKKSIFRILYYIKPKSYPL